MRPFGPVRTGYVRTGSGQFEFGFAQYDFEGAAFVATEQECLERVSKIAFGLFAGVR